MDSNSGGFKLMWIQNHVDSFSVDSKSCGFKIMWTHFLWIQFLWIHFLVDSFSVDSFSMDSFSMISAYYDFESNFLSLIFYGLIIMWIQILVDS